MRTDDGATRYAASLRRVSADAPPRSVRALLLSLIVLAATACRAQQFPTPNVPLRCFSLLEPGSYAFGVIPQHGTVSHTFAFKNGCGEAVEIEAAKPSCGCTAVIISAHTVPPGEKAEIKVNFTPQSGARGPVAKYVRVYLKGDVDPSITLEITADIRGEIETDPLRFVVDTAYVGVPFERMVTVRNTTNDILFVTAIPFSTTSYIGSDSAGVYSKGVLLKRVTLSEDSLEILPHAERKVTVRVVPEYAGRIEGSLRFSSPHSEEFVSLSATVLPAPAAGKRP